jgi:arsenate reductase
MRPCLLSVYYFLSACHASSRLLIIVSFVAYSPNARNFATIALFLAERLFMITMFGIKNCDTIKKARKWLEAEGVEYQLHDYKKDGLNPEMLNSWIKDLGWEALVNKRGTTWRKLPDDIKESIDQASAIQIMLENASIIKRPLLIDDADRKLLGFKADEYQQFFNS